MILRHPIARIVVNGQSFSSAEAAVGLVEVRLALGGVHDAATVHLWLRSRAAGIAPDAAVSIALGERSDLVDVWAGTVSHLDGGERRVVLDGLSHTARLSRQRITRVFQEQRVEDIVRDLAGEVRLDEVDASLLLPWYAVDARRSVWSHLRDLASLLGADIGSSASGGVRFVPSRTSNALHTLRYGAELIRWRLGELPAMATAGVRAYGAASEAGSQQWHWLLAESGEAGASVPAVIRTRDAADASTRARADRSARRAHRAAVLAVGSPQIRPGDVVELADVPASPLDRYRATACVHRLDGRTGFTTLLHMEGVAT